MDRGTGRSDPASRSRSRRPFSLAPASKHDEIVPAGELNGEDLRAFLRTKAAGGKKQEEAGGLVLCELFSAHELANGHYSKLDLTKIKNKPEAEFAILLDKGKLKLAKEVLQEWRLSKGIW
ncbi:hypothetical protein RvY_11439 [Ramazzottius varieornatus]|uniref:Uncharacterized protein n=1 Tax=Ramazzottius varieornatus TaxID=947166 RepID=A0A1D1VNU8_RAMVA|nr:hypothetical protein RvY_11439 [Ramazzottius varieornatus]